MEYLYKSERHLSNLCRHMHSRSCGDILIRIMSMPCSSRESQMHAKYMVIDTLIELISIDQSDQEVYVNSVTVLTELATTYSSYPDGNYILRHIIFPSVFSKILANLQSPNSAIVYHNATLLCTLLSLFNLIAVN